MTDTERVLSALAGSSPSRRRLATDRLRVLASATGADKAVDLHLRGLIDHVVEYLKQPSREKAWLAYAVLRARLPYEADVVELTRQLELNGPAGPLTGLLRVRGAARVLPAVAKSTVRVSSRVLVDVDHTATVEFATGIQRVVREAVRNWSAERDVVLVGWTDDRSALRALTEAEAQTALTGAPRVSRARDRWKAPVIVPHSATYLLPELNIDEGATRRLAALAQWSQSTTGVIGFDCVPISTSETTDEGMPAAFANNLSAVKHMTRVAAISQAAATEYAGWREMLASTGLQGPAIQPISLAHDVPDVQDSWVRDARQTLQVADTIPLVLCVGSHEPRKNHLAVLQAAELLWSDGIRFHLAFVGGNAWKSDRFEAKLAQLAGQGRPVTNVRAFPDETLWGAYRAAAFVVFPSLNEGFGLPVVESLALGTPVITSNFGSMQEITKTGGAALVDPRDDASIAQAMRMLLTDPDRLAALEGEARSLPRRTWQEYAEETWNYLVEGTTA
ncbi:glycosyltransferase family 1 protein [Diaminobutyricimonas sp. TR449]|uniref:glycosyltransferase family 4 protein n=1 Tax=Diaminobutyricimonas sp. TR449 TaxID=2708076 RepID=UPI001421C617|nr:glycosyltransferase family 1 protein [Diaminobutyricimonas sp. TR449]